MSEKPESVHDRLASIARDLAALASDVHGLEIENRAAVEVRGVVCAAVGDVGNGPDRPRGTAERVRALADERDALRDRVRALENYVEVIRNAATDSMREVRSVLAKRPDDLPWRSAAGKVTTGTASRTEPAWRERPPTLGEVHAHGVYNGTRDGHRVRGQWLIAGVKGDRFVVTVESDGSTAACTLVDGKRVPWSGCDPSEVSTERWAPVDMQHRFVEWQSVEEVRAGRAADRRARRRA